MEPVFSVVRDFNQDGHPDMAVASASDGTATIWLSRRGGEFMPGKPVRILRSGDVREGWHHSYGIAAGDFNRDSKPDIAIATCAGLYFVALGNGDGGFDDEEARTLEGLFAPTIGDLNVDGHDDLAVITGPSAEARWEDKKMGIAL